MLTMKFKITIVLILAVLCVVIISATQIIQQNEIKQIRETQSIQMDVESSLVRDARLASPTATPSPTLRVIRPLIKSASPSAK